MQSTTNTPPARIIGLTGPAGSGKDTVAALLHTHCGAHVIAFADALRAEVVDAFCIEHSMLTQRETKEHPLSALALGRCIDGAFIDRMQALYASGTRDGGMVGEQIDLSAPRSPRQIMQWWGTEYRRSSAPGYWVQKTAQRVAQLQTALQACLVVITDVRFDDEAQLVRSLGGQIWQIKRPGCEVGEGLHVSEVTGAAFAPDEVLNNCYDIRHLQQLVLSRDAVRGVHAPARPLCAASGQACKSAKACRNQMIDPSPTTTQGTTA